MHDMHGRGWLEVENWVSRRLMRTDGDDDDDDVDEIRLSMLIGDEIRSDDNEIKVVDEIR